MIRFAILGFGFMGKKHYEVLTKNPNTTVSVIIDSENPKIQDAEYFQCLDFFIQQKPNVDVVIISTPNYDHFQSAKKLLEAGYHIFLEKPYCLKTSDTEILKNVAQSNQKNIFFTKQNRNAPTAQFLKQIYDSGVLGQVLFIQTNLFWSRDERYYQPNSWKGKRQLDGGILYTQFFHFIDLILWIFGDIQIRTSTMKKLRHRNLIEIEDTGTFTFELKNNESIGVVNFSTAVYEKNYESSMTIIAENGTLKISGQYFDEVEYCNIKGFSFDENSIKKSDNFANMQEAINAICTTFSQYSDEGMHQSFDVVKKIEEIYTKAE